VLVELVEVEDSLVELVEVEDVLVELVEVEDSLVEDSLVELSLALELDTEEPLLELDELALLLELDELDDDEEEDELELLEGISMNHFTARYTSTPWRWELSSAASKQANSQISPLRNEALPSLRAPKPKVSFSMFASSGRSASATKSPSR